MQYPLLTHRFRSRWQQLCVGSQDRNVHIELWIMYWHVKHDNTKSWHVLLWCYVILRFNMCHNITCHDSVLSCFYVPVYFHISMCTFLSCDPTHNCCHLLLKRCVRSGYCISKYHSLFLPRLSQFCWTVHVLNRTKSNYMCLLSFDETCLLCPGCERYEPQPLQGPSLRRDRTFAGIDPLLGLSLRRDRAFAGTKPSLGHSLCMDRAIARTKPLTGPLTSLCWDWFVVGPSLCQDRLFTRTDFSPGHKCFRDIFLAETEPLVGPSLCWDVTFAGTESSPGPSLPPD